MNIKVISLDAEDTLRVNEPYFQEVVKKFCSLVSDIIPVLNTGGNGIHIPFHTTWLHEVADVKEINGKYNTLEKISDILNIL